MPRNMSFALTTDQVKASAKCVTRRLGWGFVAADDLVTACVKAMGLRKGEKVERLATIRVLDARWEPLSAITQLDCCLEGFPNLTPMQFVDMLCRHYTGNISPATRLHRIEFCYEQTYTRVEWTCPHCGTPNVDDYLAVPWPYCRGKLEGARLCCGLGTPWSEILPPDRFMELTRIRMVDQRLTHQMMLQGRVGEQAWVTINDRRGPLFREEPDVPGR